MPIQIRLTVLGRGAAGGAVDVQITAPADTPLEAVLGSLAATVTPGAGAPAAVYCEDLRLDPRHAVLGEPPLVEGAVLAFHQPLAAPRPPAEAARLLVVAGPDAGGVHLLRGGEVRIGRSSGADVALRDPDVSRLHCALTLGDDGAVTVTDLDSTNGTQIDGRPVTAPATPVPPGAQLRLGESTLRVVPPGTPARSDGPGPHSPRHPAQAAPGAGGTVPGPPATGPDRPGPGRSAAGHPDPAPAAPSAPTTYGTGGSGRAAPSAAAAQGTAATPPVRSGGPREGGIPSQHDGHSADRGGSAAGQSHDRSRAAAPAPDTGVPRARGIAETGSDVFSPETTRTVRAARYGDAGTPRAYPGTGGGPSGLASGTQGRRAGGRAEAAAPAPGPGARTGTTASRLGAQRATGDPAGGADRRQGNGPEDGGHDGQARTSGPATRTVPGRGTEPRTGTATGGDDAPAARSAQTRTGRDPVGSGRAPGPRNPRPGPGGDPHAVRDDCTRTLSSPPSQPAVPTARGTEPHTGYADPTPGTRTSRPGSSAAGRTDRRQGNSPEDGGHDGQVRYRPGTDTGTGPGRSTEPHAGHAGPASDSRTGSGTGPDGSPGRSTDHRRGNGPENGGHGGEPRTHRPGTATGPDGASSADGSPPSRPGDRRAEPRTGHPGDARAHGAPPSERGAPATRGTDPHTGPAPDAHGLRPGSGGDPRTVRGDSTRAPGALTGGGSGTDPAGHRGPGATASGRTGPGSDDTGRSHEDRAARSGPASARDAGPRTGATDSPGSAPGGHPGSRPGDAGPGQDAEPPTGAGPGAATAARPASRAGGSDAGAARGTAPGAPRTQDAGAAAPHVPGGAPDAHVTRVGQPALRPPRKGLVAWARRIGRGGRSGDAAEVAAARAEAAAADARWPDPAAILLAAVEGDPRLWARDAAHPDAFTVRLGTVQQPAGPLLPVTLALPEAGSLALTGPRDRLTGLARSVLAQLAALHDPGTLRIVVLADGGAREWSWLGWLPHLRPARGENCRLLVGFDPAQITARLRELVQLTQHTQQARQAHPPHRTQPRQDGTGARPADGGSAVPADAPRTVVLIDGDPGSPAAREAAVRLAAEGPAAGIHLLVLADPAGVRAPVPCATTGVLSDSVAGTLRLTGPDGTARPPVSADAVSRAWAERFARALAPLGERADSSAAPGAGAQQPLPDSVRLLDVLALPRVTPAALRERWARRSGLPVVLGLGGAGPVEVDVAAFRAPLMISGPPGSGRTELLCSLAVSLAAGAGPAALSLLLVEGSATGGGLRAAAELPQVAGHLAATDPLRMRSFAQDLRAELKRRALLLGEDGAFGTAVVAPRPPADDGGAHGAHAARATTADPASPASSAGQLPRLVVLADDLDLLLTPPLGAPGRPAAGSVIRVLEAIVREGHRLGVH
ncbi:FHA domain-containing protein, partial [Streptomyces sp. NPDC059853]|uniref:FHA domain-containing protein n=1 Tax=Streptomyces sp. NPDC059853 TaxID=3346973 RepID=UPI00364864D5